MPKFKQLKPQTVTPKTKAKAAVKTVTQKVSQNTVSVHGSALLDILEKSGLIFDSTGTVKIKFPLADSGRGYKFHKTMTINRNKEYEISCSKKTIETLTEPINKSKIEDTDHDVSIDLV